MQATSTPVHTFQLWKDAQKALNQAMQQYLESTVALQSSLYSHTHPDESHSLRTMLSETWVHDSPTADKDSILTRAQTRINQIRNSVLSVNALPLELLLRIFRFAAFPAAHTHHDLLMSTINQQGDYKDLLVLTHVCSYWRTVLLKTPSFWSYFELDTRHSIGMEGQRAEMHSERAHGTPQSLSINQNTDHSLDSMEFELILELLGLRLEDLTQLALFNISETLLVRRILRHCLEFGKPGVLRTLSIHMKGDIHLTQSFSKGATELSEQAHSILGLIHSLSLRGVKFALDSPIYENLVQLQISRIPYESSPHIHNILDILDACPLLRTLKISHISILPCDSVPLEPVYLSSLEHLDLVALTYESIDLLLPVISPQSKDLSVRITLLAIEDHLASAVYSFLKRTNVTQLFLQQELVVRCLPVVPNLRALVIDLGEQPGGPCLSEFSHVDESSSQRILQCPKLHTLHFHSGSISIETVQEIIETHPLVQKLRFSACYVDPFEDELRYWLQPYLEDVQFHLRLDETMVVDWNYLMI